MAKPKICILHDFFLYRWWAERFDVMAAQAAGADIAAAYFDEWSFDLESMGFKGGKIAFSRRAFPESWAFSWPVERWLDSKLPDRVKRLLRYALFKFAVRFRTGFLKNYDVVVFSWDTLSALPKCRKDCVKICYFHSIPRYLFDQKDLYLSKVPTYLKWPYLAVRSVVTRNFFKNLSKISKIYVNGENLKSYCAEHLGREAEILYPPVDTEEFVPCDPVDKGDYYVSFSKLATFKRVDAVVRAFKEMPDKKLLVVHGVNDPQKDEVLALAEGASNVEFRVLEDNAELPRIVARALATVFVSKNEDFWMVAIESMAAWTPVIGAYSWGIRETVVDGVTGVFVPEVFSLDDLRQAVADMTKEKSLSMKDACVARAEEFWKDRFEKEIRRAFSA